MSAAASTPGPGPESVPSPERTAASAGLPPSRGGAGARDRTDARGTSRPDDAKATSEAGADKKTAEEKPFANARTRELENELAATRAELAETVDALVERLDPRAVASRTAHRASTFVRSTMDGTAPPGSRGKLLAGVGAAAAVVAALVTARARRRH